MCKSFPSQIAFAAALLFASRIFADEWTIEFNTSENPSRVHGKPVANQYGGDLTRRPTLRIVGSVVAKSTDSMLIQSPDQRFWLVKNADVRTHDWSSDSVPRCGIEELLAMLKSDFPGHELIKTEHYLVCHDLDKDKARQAARLAEQVYRAFFEFCEENDIPAAKPEFSLILVMFKDGEVFSRHMQVELGGRSSGVVAFYQLANNRVSVLANASPTPALADYVVAPHVPLDARTALATHLVHELTHQLMCNSGIQHRLTDYPLWVSEGIAAYFEPADAFARNGWRKPGGANSIRLAQLKSLVRSRRNIELRALIGDDQVFRQAAASGESYSLAWGFCHFLLKRHRVEFVQYLQVLAAKCEIAPLTAEERFRDFEAAFKSDLSVLEREFIEYVNAL